MRKDKKILAQALADVFIPEILDELASCEEEYEISPEFEAKMDKLVRKEKRFYFPMIRTAPGKALTIALTAVIMLSVMCVSVGAVRSTVIGFVEKVFDTHREEEVPEEIIVTETSVTTSNVLYTESTAAVSAAVLTTETETVQTMTSVTGTIVKITSTVPQVTSETAVTTVTTEKMIYEGIYEKREYFGDTEFIPDIPTDAVHYGFSGYISADKIDKPYVSGKLSGGMVLRDEKYDYCKSYSISGISENAAIIVKSDKCADYLVYRGIGGADYGTIGELMDAFDLEKEMTVLEVYCANGSMENEPIRCNVDEYFIRNVFFADRQAEKIKAPHSYNDDYEKNGNLVFGIYIDIINDYSCFGVNPDGYIYTNISYDCYNSDQYRYYYIGREKAQEIIDFAKNNYTCDVDTDSYVPYYIDLYR